MYATRQVDSNLFMGSTIFRGLQDAGYTATDMAFLGYDSVCRVFEERYARYFREVKYVGIKESPLKRFCDRRPAWKLLYSFYLHFFKDGFVKPYSRKALRAFRDKNYDCMLSFLPPPFSGIYANDLRRGSHLEEVPLVQFWTDPLSLGRCDDITDIPRSRFFHRLLERRILGYADRVVFCYPLLCEMEQKLYPALAHKMTWSDVGYVEHAPFERVKNAKTTIGLFGAYQSAVRDIRPFLEMLRFFPDVQFILRGDSDVVIDAAKYPNLDVVQGRRPVDEIERLEAQCDILLCLGGRSGITHPAGKTFYYGNYDKPIVHIGDGVHNDYFKRYLSGFEGRYIICDNKPESIRAAIDTAIRILPGFKLHIPSRMEPAVIARKIIEG